MNIPSVLVSGYLGAGKTTLINDFLRDPKGLRATVLVNDFGAVNIDADLIENADGDTIALTNGCACCAIGDDLLAAARQATENTGARKPDLLVVEASGVSEPARMAMLLRGVAGLEPATVLTLINGSMARRNAQDKFISRLFRSQIANAHYVAVNRSAGHEAIVATLLQQNNPAAQPIMELAETFDAPLAAYDKSGPGCTKQPEFYSRVFNLTRPISEEELQRWSAALPVHVHRAKGLVRTSEGLKKFDYCQGTTTLVPETVNSFATAKTIVVIGTQSLSTIPEICPVRPD